MIPVLLGLPASKFLTSSTDIRPAEQPMPDRLYELISARIPNSDGNNDDNDNDSNDNYIDDNDNNNDSNDNYIDDNDNNNDSNDNYIDDNDVYQIY